MAFLKMSRQCQYCWFGHDNLRNTDLEIKKLFLFVIFKKDPVIVYVDCFI